MEYTIQQRASVWYETKIEAATEEEALLEAQNPEASPSWELLLETVIFEDDFEIMGDH